MRVSLRFHNTNSMPVLFSPERPEGAAVLGPFDLSAVRISHAVICIDGRTVAMYDTGRHQWRIVREHGQVDGWQPTLSRAGYADVEFEAVAEPNTNTYTIWPKTEPVA